MKLRQFTQIMLGVSPDRSALGTVDYVRAGDIVAGAMGAPRPGPAPSRGHDSRLAEGDVVVRGRGMAHATAVGASAAGAYPTNDVFRIRADPNVVQPEYLATFLNLAQTQGELSAGTQGAVLSRLSADALGKINVPLPAIEVQRQIAELAGLIGREQEILRKIRELRWQLNQELLHRVMKKAHDEGGYPRRGLRQAGRHASARPVLTRK